MISVKFSEIKIKESRIWEIFMRFSRKIMTFCRRLSAQQFYNNFKTLNIIFNKSLNPIVRNWCIMKKNNNSRTTYLC